MAGAHSRAVFVCSKPFIPAFFSGYHVNPLQEKHMYLPWETMIVKKYPQHDGIWPYLGYEHCHLW